MAAFATVGVSAAQYREGSHQTVLGSTDTVFNTLHKRAEEAHRWTGKDDEQTIVVDPVGSKMWVRHYTDAHFRSANRKRALDAEDISKLQGWFKSHDMYPVQYTQPSVALLESLPQMTNEYSFCHPKATTSRTGRLPAIFQLHRSNTLFNSDRSELQASDRAMRHTIDRRVFDR